MATTSTNVEEQATVDEVQAARASISQWEFMEVAPTREQVLDLLRSHRDQWGIKYEDFADYVQALPAKKKLTRKLANKQVIEVYVENWTLYVSVAGRLAMLQFLAEKNGWVIDFIPEPNTPTGIPGFLQYDTKYVYREYLRIRERMTDGSLEKMGKKSGTAWVPATGGNQAAGSNPFEKVETSARGRAIAAWGIGILPGSGIASVEEMAQILDNRQGLNRQPQPNVESEEGRVRRDDLISEVHVLMEDVRLRSNMHERAMEEKTGLYVTEKLQQPQAFAEDEGGERRLDISKINTGNLVILRNMLRQKVQQLKAEEPLG